MIFIGLGIAFRRKKFVELFISTIKLIPSIFIKMKLLILLALFIIFTTCQYGTMAANLNQADPAVYYSNFYLNIQNTGAITFDFTNPPTGITGGTDFYYEIRGTGASLVHTSGTLTLPAGGSVSDSSFTASTAGDFFIRVLYTGTLSAVVIFQLTATDSTGAFLL